jgi:NAD+ kinase
MLELVVEVDGRPLSRWGLRRRGRRHADRLHGLRLLAGGPVVWPTGRGAAGGADQRHALFARPMVAAPTSVIAFEVLPSGTTAVVACDGRRTRSIGHRARVEIRRGAIPVLLARTRDEPFTDTLVRKFHLPVEGWRGARER